MLYITLRKLKTKEWEIPYWLYFSNIVVDEAQDLSTIQLFLLKYFKRTNGRYIFILDKNQSIYAFAGANCNSYKLIKKLFTPITDFDLPINYRCPKSHLKYVNDLYNIGLKHRDNAPEGSISTISKKEAVSLLKPGDFLIGRKNKWLLPIIIELVQHGKSVYIKDKDFVEKIIKTIEKTKVSSIVDLEHKMIERKRKQKEKLEQYQEQSTKSNLITDEIVPVNHESLENYDIIINLIKNFKKVKTTFNIKEFLNYVKEILNVNFNNNSIFVGSVHICKGLEADNVFVLNKGEPCLDKFLTKDQKTQEINLSYISLTRAKDKLFLVEAEGEEYE
jgi:superfamily I DNA/RNA helicase